MVLDYLHALSKNNHIYLKIGTIPHRSKVFAQSGGLITGLQADQDFNRIDLDRNFQNYQALEGFLESVFKNVCAQVDPSFDLKSFLQEIRSDNFC